MAYSSPMVDPETGKFNLINIAENAVTLARREYGGDTYPQHYLMESLRWCQDRARLERKVWRREHGLPDDEPTVMMSIPAWGCSGDAFR